MTNKKTAPKKTSAKKTAVSKKVSKKNNRQPIAFGYLTKDSSGFFIFIALAFLALISILIIF